MILNSDSSSLAKDKALILYLLNKINKPIGNDSLLELVLTIKDMNYFYFQQFLLDLEENKYIESYEQNNEIIYRLTPSGIEALELTKDIIPGILKFKVDNNFKSNLNDIENQSSITAEYIPHNENEYSVKCKIVENNQILFELQTYAGTHTQAKSIADNWLKNANNIYPKVLELLTNIDE